MKDFAKFKEDFKEKRKEIEADRIGKIQAGKRAQLYYIIPVIFFIVGLVVWKVSIPELGVFICILSVVSVWIIATDVIGAHAKHYQLDFRKNVLNKIVKGLYPTARYSAARSVAVKHFKNSKLFKSYKIGHYGGEDYFDGKTENGYNFQLSELAVYNNTGKKGYSGTLIFKGIFAVIETPNITYNNTTVFSKRANDAPLEILRELIQKISPRSQQLILRKRLPKLDEIFHVYYGEDPKRSFEILTPAMCEAITGIHNRRPAGVRMNFLNGKIYIAIDSQVDMFRTTMDESLMNDFVFDRIYSQMRGCLELVEEVALAVETIGTLEVKDYNKEDEDKDDDMPYDHLIMD